MTDKSSSPPPPPPPPGGPEVSTIKSGVFTRDGVNKKLPSPTPPKMKEK